MVSTTWRIGLLFLALTFFGCQNTAIQQYRSIVHQADRMDVVIVDINKTISIPAGEIEAFKDVITKDIKPAMQRVFIADRRVDFFRGKDRIGYLMVQNSKEPFAYFHSASLNFGFRLTYRMGMWFGNE